MDIQQIITLALVAVAAIYLGRLGWHACRTMWSGRAGCGAACGKCVMAEIAEHKRARNSAASTAGCQNGAANGSAASAVVPLTSVRRLPTGRDE